MQIGNAGTSAATSGRTLRSSTFAQKGPNPGPGLGSPGMAEGARIYSDAWDEFSIVVDEYRELDEERVLVFDHRSGRGRVSGLELGRMRTQSAHVFHVRDGKVTNLVAYADRDRALADLGLKE